MEYLKHLNPLTKKAQFFANKVMAFSDGELDSDYCIPTLSQCFNRYSEAKKYAYQFCIDFCFSYVKALNENDYNIRIKDYGVISYNTSFFTFACVVGVYATAPEISGKWLYDKAIILTPSKQFEIVL